MKGILGGAGGSSTDCVYFFTKSASTLPPPWQIDWCDRSHRRNGGVLSILSIFEEPAVWLTCGSGIPSRKIRQSDPELPNSR